MLAFKEADLQVDHESLHTYTAAPPHHLKAVVASQTRFLDRSMSRKTRPAQPTDTTQPHPLAHTETRKCDAILDGLRSELDSYLHEPLAEPFKTITDSPGQGSHVVWCDPLRYWMARMFLCQKPAHFLPLV